MFEIIPNDMSDIIPNENGVLLIGDFNSRTNMLHDYITVEEEIVNTTILPDNLVDFINEPNQLLQVRLSLGGRKDIFNDALNTFYLRLYGRKEGSVLFKDALNTFSYGYMASDIW